MNFLHDVSTSNTHSKQQIKDFNPAYSIEKIKDHISIIKKIKDGNYNNQPWSTISDIVINLSNIASDMNPSAKMFSETIQLVVGLVDLFNENSTDEKESEYMKFLSIVTTAIRNDNLNKSIHQLRGLRSKIESNVGEFVKQYAINKALQQVTMSSNFDNNITKNDAQLIQTELFNKTKQLNDKLSKDWIAKSKMIYDKYNNIKRDFDEQLRLIAGNIGKSENELDPKIATQKIEQLFEFIRILQYRYVIFSVVSCIVDKGYVIMKQLQDSNADLIQFANLKFLTHCLKSNRVMTCAFYCHEHSAFMIYWIQCFSVILKDNITFINPEIDLYNGFRLYPMHWNTKYYLGWYSITKSIAQTTKKQIYYYVYYNNKGNNECKLRRFKKEDKIDPNGFGRYEMICSHMYFNHYDNDGYSKLVMNDIKQTSAQFVVFKAFESQSDKKGYYYISKYKSPAYFYYMSNSGFGVADEGIYPYKGNNSKKCQWKWENL